MSKHQAVRQGTDHSWKRSNHAVVSTPRKGGNAAWPSEAPLICAIGLRRGQANGENAARGLKEAIYRIAKMQIRKDS